MLSLKTIIKQDWLFILFIIIAATLLRLDLVIASNYAIESDEAIVGLMSKHILEGQPWPIFYYGQHYMGSLESILISFLALFIGLENYTLKLVPLFFSVIFVLIAYLTAFELSNKNGARIAGILAAIPPLTLVIWSSKARGGFIEVITIGSLALLILIRAIKYREVSFKSTGAVAFLLGVGWWVNNQILYFMVPTFLGVLGYALYHFKIIKTFKLFLSSLLFFILGSLPFWIYNLQNNFASLEIFSSSEGGKSLEYLQKFFDISLPILLGARNYWSVHDSYPGSSLIILVIFFVLFTIYLFFRWLKILKSFLLRFDWDNPEEILTLMLVGIILIFAFSSYGHLAEAPRYLLPIYYPLIVLTGITILKISKISKLFSSFLLVLLLVLNIISTYYPERNIQKEPLIKALDRASPNHQELISWLNKNNYQWVKTNYWIGYRLAFETKEDIRFLVFDEPLRSRIDSYEEEGEKHREEAPFVLVKSQAGMVKKALEVMGYTYKEEILSDYFVIYDVKRKYQKLKKITDLKDVIINTNYNLESIKNIIDQNHETRWGSASPQNQSMFVEINFPTPISLRSINYQLGTWETDYPRQLQIWIIDEQNNRLPLVSGSDYYFIRYLFGNEHHYSLFFDEIKVKQIRLEQTGNDSFFDWSIAELELYS